MRKSDDSDKVKETQKSGEVIWSVHVFKEEDIKTHVWRIPHVDAYLTKKKHFSKERFLRCCIWYHGFSCELFL